MTVCRLRLGFLVMGLLLMISSSALAVPMLQLDIEGGEYESLPGEETIVTENPHFTVRAYLRADGDLSQDYYLSIAIRPKTGPEDVSLGSFLLNGSTILVTDDMQYGVPPLEAVLDKDGGDLGTHDIYETFFYEHQFSFSASNMADTRNTADSPGLAIDLPDGDPAIEGSQSYVVEFEIDASLLDPGLSLHFDLYSTKLGQKKTNGDIDVDQFAPFSHDAEYRDAAVVPEPTSLAAWSLFALVGAATMLRRRRSRSSRRFHLHGNCGG